MKEIPGSESPTILKEVGEKLIPLFRKETPAMPDIWRIVIDIHNKLLLGIISGNEAAMAFQYCASRTANIPEYALEAGQMLLLSSNALLLERYDKAIGLIVAK